MRVFRSLDEVPADLGRSAVAIGKFDGVHTGHRAVVRRLLHEAETRSLTSVVVTFDRHPLALLRPDLCPSALVGNEQKLELLAETGVDATLMVAFDKPFSEQSPDAFVQSILVDALRAGVVLVGRDFRFGTRGVGDVVTLTELGRRRGFEVVVIDDVVPDGTHRVSSTWIRALMASGDVAQAATLLGSLPTVRSTVVRGAMRGRELGYPTANLDPDLEGLVPADGVYAAWLTVRGERHPAAVSVGDNPTFEGVPARQVEAYALDQDFDIYGETVEVAFVQHVRGMERFDSIEALIARMQQDEREVRDILAV